MPAGEGSDCGASARLTLQGYIFGDNTIQKGMESPTTAAEADDSYRVDDGGRCVEAEAFLSFG